MSISAVDAAIAGPPAVAKRRGRTWSWAVMFLAPLVWAPLWVRLWQVPQTEPIVGTWTGAVLILNLAIAAYTDFRWRKILNWSTYPALLWILGLSVYASWNANDVPGVDVSHRFQPWSYLGPIESLTGAGIAFLIMFGIYRLAGGGAGDVKLAAVIGAALGAELGVLALIYSYVFAATGSILNLVWTTGPTTFLGTVSRNVASNILPGLVAGPTSEQQAKLHRHIALAPFFAMGTLLVLAGVRWGA